MSKRYVDGKYYNIAGLPIAYQPSGSYFDEVYHSPDGKPRRGCNWVYFTCKAAAITMYETELAWRPMYRSFSHGVLPCCHAITLCSNCARYLEDHSDGKCLYGPGRTDISMSHMDIYCPGWKDRWIGND